MSEEQRDDGEESLTLAGITQQVAQGDLHATLSQDAQGMSVPVTDFKLPDLGDLILD